MQRKHSDLVESATPPPMSLSGGKSRLSSDSSRLSESGSGAKPKRRSLRNKLRRESDGDKEMVSPVPSVIIPSPVKAMSRSELRSWAKQHQDLGINGNSSSRDIRHAIAKHGAKGVAEGSANRDATLATRFGWTGVHHSFSKKEKTDDADSVNKRIRRKVNGGSKIPIGRWR